MKKTSHQKKKKKKKQIKNVKFFLRVGQIAPANQTVCSSVCAFHYKHIVGVVIIVV